MTTLDQIVDIFDKKSMGIAKLPYWNHNWGVTILCPCCIRDRVHPPGVKSSHRMVEVSKELFETLEKLEPGPDRDQALFVGAQGRCPANIKAWMPTDQQELPVEGEAVIVPIGFLDHARQVWYLRAIERRHYDL